MPPLPNGVLEYSLTQTRLMICHSLVYIYELEMTLSWREFPDLRKVKARLLSQKDFTIIGVRIGKFVMTYKRR